MLPPVQNVFPDPGLDRVNGKFWNISHLFPLTLSGYHKNLNQEISLLTC